MQCRGAQFGVAERVADPEPGDEVLGVAGVADQGPARAVRLVLSPHTVHRHVANIRTKLGLPSRAAAAAHATRLGLL